jgi:hypothetical protein
LDVFKEGAELLGIPDVHLGRHALGQVGCRGDVAGDIAPANGILERGMQGTMNIADGLRGKTAAIIAPPAVQQRPVEGGELGRGKPLERDPPEGRDNVPLDVELIAHPG